MNLAELKKLIEIFNHNDKISKLSLKQDNFELKLDKTPTQTTQIQHAPQPQAQVQHQIQATTQAIPESSPSNASSSDDSSGDFITSPMVGTFYHKPSPDAAPYVKVGDKVKKGQTIGIVEAMKIMNEIEAEFDCKIIAIEAADGQPVEYGSKLIKVEKI